MTEGGVMMLLLALKLLATGAIPVAICGMVAIASGEWRGLWWQWLLLAGAIVGALLITGAVILMLIAFWWWAP